MVKTSVSTWKFLPTLQPTHMGFCSFARCQIIKMEKEEGSTLRSKNVWKAGAASKDQ